MKKRYLAIALSLCVATGLQPALAQAGKKKAAPAAAKSLSVTPKTPSGPDKEANLLKIGKANVSLGEFLYVYKKNNSTAADSLYLEKNLREYIQLYSNFKLKVLDAQAKGLDTTDAYRKELETYRKQLAQPYLTEKSVTENLVKEAYTRMQTEVSASHILIMVSPDAAPKDTLEKYKKIEEIRAKALAPGANFDELAKKYSEDPSAKQNGGSLGFFTALQMVYPFEDVAYKTPVGKVSKIIRTRFGYHILKVADKRSNQGSVKVAHIMVKFQAGQSREDSIAAKEKINEIAAKIKKAESFETLAQQFSDDQGTKDKGGVLPMFSSGQMIPAFESKAFALGKVNDVSEPFQTAYGFHIIKLLEKKPLEKFEEVEQSLRDKVKRDSRSEVGETALLARLHKENKFVENTANFNLAVAKADTSLSSGRWTYDTANTALLNKSIISIQDKNYTVGQFFKYVKANQQNHKSTDPAFMMKTMFKDFGNVNLKQYEEEHLEAKYEDFRMLMREYREGILLFTLMDQKVWSKAIEDTTGLKSFFKLNNEKYRWNQRVKATVYSAKDDATLARVKSLLAQKTFEVNEPRFDALVFDKNAASISNSVKLTLKYVAETIKRDNNLSLVIPGQQEGGEKKKASLKRAEIVRDSLIKFGVAASRLTIKDLGKVEGTSPELARQLKLQSFSSSAKAMERLLNNNAPLTLQVTDGAFQKGENKLLDAATWSVGERITEDNGRKVLIVTHAIEAPRLKNLEECRGIAISDYQNHLEKEWVEGLRKQYPMVVVESVFNTIVKK